MKYCAIQRLQGMDFLISLRKYEIKKRQENSKKGGALTRKSLFFIFLSLSYALLLAPVPAGYGIAWGAEESEVKKDCVSLGAEEIKEVLKKLNVPDANVISIADSAMKGICEIAIDIMGQTKIFYLDVYKKYLINGSLVEVSTMTNKTMEAVHRIQDKKRIDIAKIPLNNALVLGEKSAAKKVVVFTDPDCPFCGQLHQTMKQIVAERKDIAFYIKFLPLEFHKDAYWKAKSIVCNKSVKMLEDNFEKREIPKTECATDEIENSVKLAKSFGIGGTPSLILPDGRLKAGALPQPELLDLIDGKK
jgi:thiol:disulfide interchange protein DsbC